MTAKAPPHQAPLTGIVMPLVGVRLRQRLAGKVGDYFRPGQTVTGPYPRASGQQVGVAGHQERASKRMRGSNQASTTSESSVLNQMIEA